MFFTMLMHTLGDLVEFWHHVHVCVRVRVRACVRACACAGGVHQPDTNDVAILASLHVRPLCGYISTKCVSVSHHIRNHLCIVLPK